MRHLPLVALLGVALSVPGIGNAACTLPLSKPATIYLDNGNGTVTDSETGLVWQKCPVGLSDNSCTTGSAASLDWQAALSTAEAYVFAGYSDWRLPNAKELASLADKACNAPAANVTVFPVTQSASYWTSSPASQVADSAWVVDFSVGSLGTETKDTLNYVRLVRGGY